MSEPASGAPKFAEGNSALRMVDDTYANPNSSQSIHRYPGLLALFLPFSCHLPQNVSLCWKKHRSIERKDARTVIHKSSINSANVAHLRHELPHVLRPRARSRLSRAGQTGAVDEHFYGTGLLLPGNFHENGSRGIAGAA